MDETFWIAGVRAAGVSHVVTVIMAHFTPIPPEWDKNLAGLPEVHRRFAVAQNLFIGATMLFAGVVSLVFARDLVEGSTGARIVCAGIALWWLGRLLVLPWLRVWSQLQTWWLRLGFVLLYVECATLGGFYGWLACRAG